MKCIRCGKDSNKRDREGAGGRCPRCRHPFVAKPEKDKVTDRLIKNAEMLVSGNGTFYFLSDQLKYEIMRRRLKKARAVGMGCLGIGLVAFMVLAFWHLDWALAGITLVLIIVFFSRRTKQPPLTPLLQRWEQTNPNDKLLSRPASRPRGGPSQSSALGDVSFDRVLICDRDEYAEFFLANLFHFHYACPVLSAGGYPKDVFPDMLRRLKANPSLTVFLVHDLTPAGLDFVQKIKNSPTWFGNHHTAIVIDLGLSPEQKKFFSRMLVPLRTIPQATGSLANIPGLPSGKGVELSVFPPELLIKLCGAGLNERQPFHLLDKGADGGNGGYG